MVDRKLERTMRGMQPVWLVLLVIVLFPISLVAKFADLVMSAGRRTKDAR